MSIVRTGGILCATIIFAASFSAAVDAQEVRPACGEPPPRMRAISDQVLAECRIAELNQHASEYLEIASYHWCHFDLAKRAKEEAYDDVTYSLVQGELDAGVAVIKAAKGAAGRNSKDVAGSAQKIAVSMEHLSDAYDRAEAGFGDSETQDESFRLAMNAMHQAENAAKIAQQMALMSEEGDPACQSDEGMEIVAATYSGFGMTVEILTSAALRVTSDCGYDDHRIQFRGPTGTWSTKSVGVSQVLIPDIDPDLTYYVRRRCGHTLSGELEIDIQTLTRTSTNKPVGG